jgi:hypothetical protein
LRLTTRCARSRLPSCWICDGVGSSMRRSAQCSSRRFQYVPYTRRVPSPTAPETTGTYWANVGTGPPGHREPFRAGCGQEVLGTHPEAQVSGSPKGPTAPRRAVLRRVAARVS